MAADIHSTAVVDDKARLGEGVVIGPYAVVEGDTVIGDGCRLDSFSQVKRYTVMGRDNHVHSYACVGDEPQDISYKGEETRVIIGDGNAIREHVTIHRGTVHGDGATRIGSHCMLMAYCHVGHDCVLGDHVIMANAANLGGHVTVGDHAVISGLTAVQQFARIGEYAFIGGMSGCAQDVPPYMLAYGVRAKLFGPNSIGLQRHGFSSATRKAIKAAYKAVFRSETLREQALDQVERDHADVPEVQRFVQFIRQSKRGIIPDTSKNGGTSGH